jgi:ribosomal protein L9
MKNGEELERERKLKEKKKREEKKENKKKKIKEGRSATISPKHQDHLKLFNSSPSPSMVSSRALSTFYCNHLSMLTLDFSTHGCQREEAW